MTLQILITGRVQGVGFRAFTQRLGVQYGLDGWVRNLLDGRVEILVRGEEGVLICFQNELKKGPSRGHVQTLNAKPLLCRLELKDFVVEKDGGEPWSDS